MEIGLSYDVFWKITPHELKIMFDAYKEQQKQKNYMMWLDGQYTMSALAATVGNIFRKKGTKPTEYMEKPIPIFEEQRELTEEEKITEEQKLLLALKTMQSAFEMNKR